MQAAGVADRVSKRLQTITANTNNVAVLVRDVQASKVQNSTITFSASDSVEDILAAVGFEVAELV